MKNLKRWFSMTLVLCLLISTLPMGVLAVDGVDEDEIFFEMELLEDDGLEDELRTTQATGDWVTVDGIEGGQICFDSSTGTITDAETSITIANIPSTIDGYAVVSIGAGAFRDCTNLERVEISGSITTIGSYVFDSCTSLETIGISDSVASIGSGAFSHCESLESIVIPDSVISIGYSVFFECTSLENIEIQASITSIGGFYGCVSLTSIEIPDTVTRIDELAFFGCENLTSIEIPDLVTTIATQAFDYCERLASITIPKSVTTIDAGAFWHCSALTDVYYAGSESDWAAITITGSYNTCLTDATIHYGIIEDVPTFVLDSTNITDGILTTTEDELVLVFSESLKSNCDWTANKAIHIKNSDTGETVLEVDDAVFYSHYCSIVDNTMTIPFWGSLDTNASYYVEIDAGLILSSSGETFAGLDISDGICFTFEAASTQYTSGFQINVDAFSFNNTAYFFNDKYYITDSDYLSLLARLSLSDRMIVDFAKLINLSGSHNGSCFGMTSVMALMYDNVITPQEVQAGAYTVAQLNAPFENLSLASMLTYYHLLQYISSFQNLYGAQSQYTMAQSLVHTLRSNQTPVIVNFNLGEGAHSILAFALEDDPSLDYYTIYTADPNNLYNTIDNQSIEPGYIAIEKSTLDVLKICTGSGYFYDYESLIYIITDFSSYDDVGTYDTSTTVLTTTATNFSISADDLTATVSDGVIHEESSLDITKSSGTISGTDDTTVYTYFIEDAQSYSISYDDGTSEFTSLVFANNDTFYSSVSSDATEITFDSTGTTSISGSTGDSTFVIANENIVDGYSSVEISTQSAALSVTNTEDAVEVSTQDDSQLEPLSVSVNSSFEQIPLTANKTIVSSVTISGVADDNTVTIQSKDEILATASATYYMVYDSMGGTDVSTQTGFTSGDTVTEPVAPTKDGYTFAGWYTSSDFTYAWDFETDTITENLILYAKWDANSTESCSMSLSYTAGTAEVAFTFYNAVSDATLWVASYDSDGKMLQTASLSNITSASTQETLTIKTDSVDTVKAFLIGETFDIYAACSVVKGGA